MKKMVSLLLAFVIGFQTLIVSEAYSVNLFSFELR